MSDLTVENGVVSQSSTSTTKTNNNPSSLDKDAFLQLLVTQMKYQDPLNPSTDTQFVDQLATFSQLEQMQNLNQTTNNNQAFGLVGATVVVSSTDSSGKSTTVTGTVDYVVMNNGKAELSIDDNLYSLDDLQQVYDSSYILEQGLPYLTDSVEATFDKDNPEDISFEVNLGSGDTIATDVAFIIDDTVIDPKYVTLDGNKVTISKEALAKLDNGTYKPAIMFNDAMYTTIGNKITLTVTGTGSEDDGSDGDSDGSDGDGEDSNDDSDDTTV